MDPTIQETTTPTTTINRYGMDGADTGATGGPITHGGPGDIGGLDLKAVDSVDSLFFRISKRAIVFLRIPGPELWPYCPNYARDSRLSMDNGPDMQAVADGPRNPYIASSN
jgi:hypothetical protein